MSRSGGWSDSPSARSRRGGRPALTSLFAVQAVSKADGRPPDEGFHSGLLAQLARYGMVSVISTAVSMTVLASLVFTGAVSAGWANVLATAAGTVPSFELNRRWVWRKTGRRSVRAEVGPFCAMSFAGLALSTLAVSVVVRWAGIAGLGAGMRALLALAANATAFGSLWIAQFVILDRVLFRAPDPSPLLVHEGVERCPSSKRARCGRAPKRWQAGGGWWR